MLHHSLSRVAAQTMVSKWKTCQWTNDHISTNVHLGCSQNYFPAPDATLIDPTNELTITVEFKPPYTSKRDILTGVGQAISYLEFSSISYLVIPEFVEGFPIGEYVKQLFESKRLNQLLPMGLIIYDNDDPSIFKDLMDISTGMALTKIYDKRSESRYWAPYKDSNPHTIWLLLDTAYLLNETVDRKWKIWDIFFDKYYCPVNKRYNDQVCETNINHWNEGNMPGFAKRFRPVKERYTSGELNLNELTSEIDRIIGKNNSGDSLYKSYFKNRHPFLTRLGLWDEQFYLTELGYELHKIGKIHGPNSKTFRDELAKTILIKGRHLDLIIDIENVTRNKNFQTVGEAKKAVADYLEDRGLIKRNPNRSSDPENAKDDFESEFQLWGKLDFVEKVSNKYYTKEKGFNFNWGEITRVLYD